MLVATESASPIVGSLFTSAVWLSVCATVVAAAWGHIHSSIAKIWNLAFTSVTIAEGGNNLWGALETYFNANGKRLRLNGYTFTDMREFVRPVKRVQMVAVELLGDGPCVFWFGWKPIMVFTGNENSSTGQGNTTSKRLHLTFIRGTFNIDALLIEAVNKENDKELLVVQRLKVNNEAIKICKINVRFTVHHMTGVSKSKDSRSGSPPALAGNTREDVNYLKRFRLLGHNQEDIGPELPKETALEVLSFPPYIMKAIANVKYWLKSEDWYRERSIPWTHGMTLYGGPGTGKTALIRAIGQDLDLPIYVFDIATMCNEELISAWNTMLCNVPCIAVIDDMDGVFHGRKNITTQQTTGLSFDCLLNCLSGIQTASGVFKVITTNHIELIDEAIGIPKPDKAGSWISTRPGRMDIALELPSRLALEGRHKLANRIMSDCPHLKAGVIEIGTNDTPAQFEMRCTEIARAEYWKLAEPPESSSMTLGSCYDKHDYASQESQQVLAV